MCDSQSYYAGCTYTTAPQVYDGTIVGPRVGNDFQFFGLNSGPGISISELTNSVEVSQSVAFNPVGLYMNMGNDLTHVSQIDYYPSLDDSGFGQYNDGLYADGFVTTPLDSSYFISVMVSYVGSGLIIRLEDSAGISYGHASSNYSSPRADTLSFTEVVDIPANTRLRVRISSYTHGVLLLSRSRLTFSTL